jgi:hypothetical protein
MTNFRKATRQRVKLKLGLVGPAGSGKTYSALQLASGMTDWDKIALIDTENGSGDLYSHLGPYNVVSISAPFHPNKYIEAIKRCEEEGMELIIIDSVTQEWSGKGGCLDIHEQETAKMKMPNSFTAWAKVTPLHQSFVDTILQSPCHIITTIRSKSDYVLTERNGRQVPQKVGLAAIQRDGFDFDLSVSFDIDAEHKARASKDRTGLFVDQPSFTITQETGRAILSWCNSGAEPIADPIDGVVKVISECDDLPTLQRIYTELTEDVKKDERVQQAKDARKAVLSNGTAKEVHHA